MAFKQIIIYHLQLTYFAFNFDGNTYVSLIIDFSRSDASREFSKWPKSLVFIAINTHPDLFTKTVNPFEGTVYNFTMIMKQHDS